MSVVVQWAKLTPEQRDRLVAEKVMGWQKKPCPMIGRSWEEADPIGNDDTWSWQCRSCFVTFDHSSDWDVIEHAPMRDYLQYSQRMDAAMKIIARFQEVHIFYLKQRSQQYRVLIELASSSHVVTMNSLSEAICVAALRAYGMEVEA